MALLNKTKISIGKKGAQPTTFTPLPACTNLPDFGSDPEFVSTTTIDDDNGTNELGVGDASDIVFTFRYRTGKVGTFEPSFKTLNALVPVITSEELYTIKVEFKSGLVITFDVSGVSIKVLGGGLNDVSNFEASFGLASQFTMTEAVVSETK